MGFSFLGEGMGGKGERDLRESSLAAGCQRRESQRTEDPELGNPPRKAQFSRA